MNLISNANTYTATMHKDVTSMRCMFFNRPEIVSVDLSKLNTAKVTNMDDMFNNCVNLTMEYLISIITVLLGLLCSVANW